MPHDDPVLNSTNHDGCPVAWRIAIASTDAWKSIHGHSMTRSSLSSAVAPAAKHEIHPSFFSTEARLWLVPVFGTALNHAAASTIRLSLVRVLVPRTCVFPDGTPIFTTSTMAPELILPHDDWSSTVGTHTVQDCRYGLFTFRDHSVQFDGQIIAHPTTSLPLDSC